MPDKPRALLTEGELRVLSRQIKTIVPRGEDQAAEDKYIATVQSVLETCRSQHLTTMHQVAAWNAMSTLLEQTAAHSSSSVQSLIWTSGLWERARNSFLLMAQDARPKSVKQLLTALTKSLQKTQGGPEASQDEQDTTRLLVRTIVGAEREWPVRPCMLLLSAFLRKGVVQLSSVVIEAQAARSDADASTLLQECMQTAATSEGASAAGQLLATILDQTDNEANNAGTLWVTPLVQLLQRHPDRHQAFRQHLMSVLFVRNGAGFHQTVIELGYAEFVARSPMPRARLLSLLTTLQAGNDLGLVFLVPGEAEAEGTIPVPLPVSVLAALLQHGDREIRAAGLACLIQSRTISEPVHASILSALQQALPNLHADTDPNFRSELFSLTQKLFDRLRSSLATTIRTQPSHDCVRDARAYLQWYHRFLLRELRPSASYQRHISALRCLHILMRSGVDSNIAVDHTSKATISSGQWPFSIIAVTQDFEEVLISTLVNPFDDVRSNAAAILDLHMQSLPDKKLQHQRLDQALGIVEGLMLASGRADHADTVALLYSLYYSSAPSAQAGSQVLDDLIAKTAAMLDSAQSNLAQAVREYPLHGVLISVRHLLEKYTLQQSLDSATINHLAALLHKVWNIVRPVLCDDAPEGLLPDDVVGASDVTSKAVLSYCWRALKEASLLIDSILAFDAATAVSWSPRLKLDLIELTFTQLAVLRHRGAFSIVAQTWNRCCTQVEPHVTLRELFDRALALIKGTTINTRRSAGMPSIVCGILIADKSNTLLQPAFANLEQIARQPVLPGQDDESSLPQVHAMNCIKDIVKNTKLAEYTDAFVPATLQLAADSLPSSTWAIRNCGLMLFRACIDRLLGTNDAYEDSTNDRSVMDFRKRAPLLEQVLTLLPRNGPSHTREGVFPALQLLQRSFLPADHRAQVHSTIITLLNDESWHVRDKAAKTLVSVMTQDELSSEISSRLSVHEHGTIDHNGLHGLLLCLKHLDRQVPADGEGPMPQGKLLELRDRAQAVASSSGCAHIYAMAAGTTQSGSVQVDELVNPCAGMSATSALHNIDNLDELDAWLLARAVNLEQRAAGGATDESLLPDIKDWATTCALSMTGDSIFSTETVANSLQPLRKIYVVLGASDTGITELLRLALLLYDLLQDDDEDVRNLACQPVIRMLGGDDLQSLVSLAASQRLIALMVRCGKALPSFWDACVHRALAFDEYENRSISTILCERPAEETDLFAIEKQNLYIDSVAEARTWSLAAIRCTGDGGGQLPRLTSFVSVGLNELLQRTNASAHGVLGWSTSGDAFVLGLRILFGAEILLSLSNRGVKLPMSPLTLRGGLVKLAEAAEEARLHPIWRTELDRISKAAAVSGFSAIQSMLNGVIGKLDSATPLA